MVSITLLTIRTARGWWRLGANLPPPSWGGLFFVLLLPVSILFCRDLLWAVRLEVHLPDTRQIRLLCGYDVWRQVRNRIAAHDRRAGEIWE